MRGIFSKKIETFIKRTPFLKMNKKKTNFEIDLIYSILNIIHYNTKMQASEDKV